jgi:predicted PurR-regulated permease PerM
MSETSFHLTDRERRWFDTLLVLAVVAVAMVTAALLAGAISYFAEPLLIFFLAWLLAFILSPIVSLIVRAVPFLRRGLAVLLVYLLLMIVLLGLALLVAQGLASSITSFIQSLPDLQARLPEILSRYNGWLHSLGFQVDLVVVARGLLSNAGTVAANLAQPLSQIAVASLGALGNVLIIFFLSLYMVIDRDRLLAFFVRLVPPQYADEARLFETSVGRSFGGFLRGQALMGFMYAVVAAVPVLLFGLDYGGFVIAVSGVLQAIPFFGPFISWAPPVLVAVLTKPDVAIFTLLIMVAGWLIVMNLVQPRLMSHSVGIHPIVVLGSVIVGAKVAGIVGVIFGIPVAAVLSAFFNYYMDRTTADRGTVASRAAERVARREGHPVRVPEPPGLADEHRRPEAADGAADRTAGAAGPAGAVAEASPEPTPDPGQPAGPPHEGVPEGSGGTAAGSPGSGRPA